MADLSHLNAQQRAAVVHGDGPLLIIAGAGTGKTTTLAHRVAHLIHTGVSPGRLLLLTFARRAAGEMLRRVDAIRRQAGAAECGSRVWGGTFHAVAARLLRIHGRAIDLPPDFTVLDRADAEDLLDVLRTELSLAKGPRRFPRKGTCLEIYSRCVNARQPLEDLLERAYPWCRDDAPGLRELFRAYVDRKGEQSVLDYDDLLLFFHGLLGDPSAGAAVRERFDRVLVDEYQDTNALQAEILRLLSPEGRGLTVVGDDAQAIYSFRAATVRNILDFPVHFPGATVVALEESYRSTPSLLAATNRVISLATERHEKTLWSRRRDGPRPVLLTCADESEETDRVLRHILEHREAGLDLRRQAVLFRAAHHSLALELELGRRNIPFHKYGGLRFLEAAHVKDLTAFLRLAENPRDLVAGTRVLLLLPSIGPKRARQLMALLATGGFEAWKALAPSEALRDFWPELAALMGDLAARRMELPAELGRVRAFYAPLLERRYDNAAARLRDLDQLEHIAARYPDRQAFLTELTLDPPTSTQELAGPPLLDDDYLILSTIHSAKGLEWDAVYVIHAADGNIPSDLSTGRAEEIEEERRLFYVALTRARDFLYVCHPLRAYARPSGVGDAHTYSQLTRFLPREVQALFDARRSVEMVPSERPMGAAHGGAAIRKQIRDLWS
jgi:DNA helicase-2/ATP-dependent DNA helicase PcrA